MDKESNVLVEDEYNEDFNHDLQAKHFVYSKVNIKLLHTLLVFLPFR